jgi:hypothetical protein
MLSTHPQAQAWGAKRSLSGELVLLTLKSLIPSPSDEYARVTLTPAEAREIAARLLELAREAEEGK